MGQHLVASMKPILNEVARWCVLRSCRWFLKFISCYCLEWWPWPDRCFFRPWSPAAWSTKGLFMAIQWGRVWTTTIGFWGTHKCICLVVWNMFYDFPILSIYWECHHLNWWTHIHLYGCSDTAIWNGPVAPWCFFWSARRWREREALQDHPEWCDYPLLYGISTEEKGTYSVISNSSY